MRWLSFLSSPSREQLERRKRYELRRAAIKPRIGATIYCADLRMSVPPGMSDELWRWLVERGWRELDDLSLRHRLRALPASRVTALIDGTPDQWEELLADAIRHAIRKPTIERARVFA